MERDPKDQDQENVPLKETKITQEGTLCRVDTPEEAMTEGRKAVEVAQEKE